MDNTQKTMVKNLTEASQAVLTENKKWARKIHDAGNDEAKVADIVRDRDEALKKPISRMLSAIDIVLDQFEGDE